jgi:hypothetical protein
MNVSVRPPRAWRAPTKTLFVVKVRTKLELDQYERPTANRDSAVRRRPSIIKTVVFIYQKLSPLSDSPKTPRKAASTGGAFTRESGHLISGSIGTTSRS